MKAHATVVLAGKIYPVGSEIPDSVVAVTGLQNPEVLGDQAPVPKGGGGVALVGEVVVMPEVDMAAVEEHLEKPPKFVIPEPIEEPWDQLEASIPTIMAKVDKGELEAVDVLTIEQGADQPRVTLVRALNEMMTEAAMAVEPDELE